MGIAEAVLGGAVLGGLSSMSAADTAASATESAANTSAAVQREEAYVDDLRAAGDAGHLQIV